MGKSGASPLYVLEVFKAPVMKELIMADNKNGYYSQIMTGLCGLFAHDAICKITTSDTGNEKKTISECYYPLCIYLVSNHMTMSNHIHYHLQLALVCCIKHCFHVETQACPWCHFLSHPAELIMATSFAVFMKIIQYPRQLPVVCISYVVHQLQSYRVL